MASRRQMPLAGDFVTAHRVDPLVCETIVPPEKAYHKCESPKGDLASVSMPCSPKGMVQAELKKLLVIPNKAAHGRLLPAVVIDAVIQTMNEVFQLIRARGCPVRGVQHDETIAEAAAKGGNRRRNPVLAEHPGGYRPAGITGTISAEGRCSSW